MMDNRELVLTCEFCGHDPYEYVDVGGGRDFGGATGQGAAVWVASTRN